MAGILKTEEGTRFNLASVDSADSGNNIAEGRKVKLMYTSEFLKSFDKAPKSTPTITWDDFDIENKKNARTKELQTEKLKDKLEMKDMQIQQLRYLLARVKDVVMERRDEELVAKMKDILNENEEGRLILSPPAPETPRKKVPGKEAVKVPPIKLPEEELPQEPVAALTPTAGAPTSPVATSPPPPSPSSTSINNALLQPPPAKSALRSPRRVTKPQPVATVVVNKNTMKKSPSMPVINDRQKQDQNTHAQLKLQKKTKSTEDATIATDKKKVALDEGVLKKTKEKESVSPRKGIKKSVSMGSICMDDKERSAIKVTSLEEIVGQIYPLTKYQAGCRFLQKKLEESPDSHHVTLVFNEVFDHLIELMTDPYGQYLVPKLMKYCDKGQRQMIVNKIAPKIVTFACHTYGIHGVQKILEFLTDEQVNLFIEVIKPNVIQLAKDPKGNYLIQSFLKQFPSERNQFIYDSIVENAVEVATHKVGCTLVNRCIDHANEQQMQQLVHKITSSALSLVQDQYGNYVVQHLLSSSSQTAPLVIKSLLGHIAELSVQKFSSNVIEKCLQVATPEMYTSIIKEITEANLLDLLQDRYANFVIQTALDVADDVQHAKLVKLILPYIHQIKTPYVMHIQKKILQV